MKIIKRGSGQYKILIVHGWMHSSCGYKTIGDKLLSMYDCELYLFDSPSFGINKPITYKKMLDTHGKILSKLIHKHEFDLIIGHSMGGSLVIRAVENLRFKKIPKIILACPEYYGINKFIPFAFTPRLLAILVSFLKRYGSKKFLTKFVKKLSTLYVKDSNLIDEDIVNIVVNSHSLGSMRLLRELAFDRHRIKDPTNFSKTLLIISEDDAIISKKKIKMLIKDGQIPQIGKFNNIFHTPVIECSDDFFEKIVDFIES